MPRSVLSCHLFMLAQLSMSRTRTSPFVTVDLFVSGALSSVGKGCGVLESGVCLPSRLAYVVETMLTVANFKIAGVLRKKHTPVVNAI